MYEAEHPSLEVLPVAYDGYVNVGRAVGLTREGVHQSNSQVNQNGFSRSGQPI